LRHRRHNRIRLTCLAALAGGLILQSCSQDSGAPAATPAAPVVETTGGALRGAQSGDAGSVTAFLGIPFAAPPVDALRWQAPEPAPAWDGIRDATAFAPACMQTRSIVDWYRDVATAFDADPGLIEPPSAFSEDCLYLNVWTPAPQTGEALPVMVYIHGGSYTGGWSYEPNYRGAELASHGVVVVSIAYRLGALGYLSPPDTARDGLRNFGLLDQIAGLQWVQDNIAGFGGDPGNVTVFGESAGAASVGVLLTSPASEGLFHRAISQSGGFELHTPLTAQAADAAFARLQARLGEDALRSIPAERIVDAAADVLSGHDFGPVAPAASLPLPPSEALDAGAFHAMPLLIGTNADEWLMYIDADTAASDLADWQTRLGDAVDIAALSPSGDPRTALDRLETADQMRCPGYRLADAMEAAGEPARVYLFTRVRPGEAAAAFGAYHGAELPYVFGTHDDWLPTAADDVALGNAMRSAWVRFARNGSPGAVDGTEWPRFGASRHVLELGDTVRPIDAFDIDLCDAITAEEARP